MAETSPRWGVVLCVYQEPRLGGCRHPPHPSREASAFCFSASSVGGAPPAAGSCELPWGFWFARMNATVEMLGDELHHSPVHGQRV